jgi:hypothetical protein
VIAPWSGARWPTRWSSRLRRQADRHRFHGRGRQDHPPVRAHRPGRPGHRPQARGRAGRPRHGRRPTGHRRRHRQRLRPCHQAHQARRTVDSSARPAHRHSGREHPEPQCSRPRGYSWNTQPAHGSVLLSSATTPNFYSHVAAPASASALGRGRDGRPISSEQEPHPVRGEAHVLLWHSRPYGVSGPWGFGSGIIRRVMIRFLIIVSRLESVP